MLRSLLFLLSIVLVSCKETPKTTVTEVGEVLATDISYSEKYRPQFHFSPPKQLLFDRTQSGKVEFAEKFAGSIQKQAYKPKDQWAEVRIILDASSVEIFIDMGRYVFTNQIFPRQPYSILGITGSQDAELRQFHLNQLTSIWKNYE